MEAKIVYVVIESSELYGDQIISIHANEPDAKGKVKECWSGFVSYDTKYIYKPYKLL